MYCPLQMIVTLLKIDSTLSWNCLVAILVENLVGESKIIDGLKEIAIRFGENLIQ